MLSPGMAVIHPVTALLRLTFTGLRLRETLFLGFSFASALVDAGPTSKAPRHPSPAWSPCERERPSVFTFGPPPTSPFSLGASCEREQCPPFTFMSFPRNSASGISSPAKIPISLTTLACEPAPKSSRPSVNLAWARERRFCLLGSPGFQPS